jgi:hypothetical protein
LIAEPRHRLYRERISTPQAWVNAQGLIEVANAGGFQPIEKVLEKCEVFTFPKYLKGSARKFAGSRLFSLWEGRHQVHVAIGAVGETGAVLDAALRAKHGRKCSTKDCAASYSASLELSVTFVSCFSISAYSASASRPFFVIPHIVCGYFPLNLFSIAT